MTSNVNDNTTPRQKGAYFLQWVASHGKEMRKALKKNCTYDCDLFDDVYNETIINVYNTITNNNKVPDNIKNYFFSSLKFCYRMRQNQGRARKENSVRDYWDRHQLIDEKFDQKAKESDINAALSTMREVLAEEYGEDWADIFFEYWQGRMWNDTSYQIIANKYHIGTAEEVMQQLQSMRGYVTQECRYLRELFTNDYADN